MSQKSQDPSRRDFLKATAVGAAASVAGLAAMSPGGAASAPASAADYTAKHNRPFELALASYTLREFSLDETLVMTNRVGLKAICLKSFHLPLESTPEEIAAAKAKVKAAGLVLDGCGVVTMTSEEQVAQAFDYAKAAGMANIVAMPSAEMLPLINDKIQQYDIRCLIHNHGPGDQHFPTPVDAYDKIKNLDRRFGICHDIGHTLRYGKDPVAQTEKCADRIYDIHIKDEDKAAPEGKAIACGRGVIDLPAILRTLVKINYKGYLSFEYEDSPDDPMPGLCESVGYINGVMDAM